jgi:U3 small nucleolar RNA-associated protein 13
MEGEQPASNATSQGRESLKSSFVCERKIESFFSSGRPALGDGFLLSLHNDSLYAVDLNATKILHRLHAEEDSIVAFALHPNNEEVVSSGKSGMLRQWELETGKCVKSWKAHKAPVLGFAFSGDGSFMATASADRAVQVWDYSKGYCTHVFRGHSSIVTGVRFHPDTKHLYLFSWGDDGSLRKWDLHTRKCVLLENHLSAVTDVCFLQGGNQMVSVGRDKVMNLWDLTSNSLLRTFPVFEVLEAVCALGPSALQSMEEGTTNRQLVAIGGERGTLHIWDLAQGKCKASQALPVSPGHAISSILWWQGAGGEADEEAGAVVCGTTEYSVGVVDASTLRLRKHLVGHLDEVIDLKYLASRQVVVITNSPQAQVLNLDDGDSRVLSGHREVILSGDVSCDGKLVATGSKDHTVCIWETSSGLFRCVGVCLGHTQAVHALGFASRGPNLLLSGSKDRTLKLWELPHFSGDAVPELASPTQINNALYTRLAHEKVINCVAFSPNDKLFASGSQDKTIKVWNREGEEVATLQGHRRGVWALQFSPVEKCLASASADKTIKLWSLTDFTCLKTLEGHTASVLRVAFVTNGMQLLSTGGEGAMKLWTIKTDQCVGTFSVHSARVWAMTVEKGENEVICGGADSLITIWRDSTEADQERAAALHRQQILQEQEMEKCIRKGDWGRAVTLALSLERPQKLHSIFQQLISLENGKDQLKAIIQNFTLAQLGACFKYIRDWNTRFATRPVAQHLLYTILHTFPPSALFGCPDIKPVLEALIPYTDRHLERMDRLLQQSFLLDYTLHGMNMLHPLPELESNTTATINSATESEHSSTEEAQASNVDGEEDGDEDEDEDHLEQHLPPSRKRKLLATPNNTKKGVQQPQRKSNSSSNGISSVLSNLASNSSTGKKRPINVAN